jgi:hypothetical protein
MTTRRLVVAALTLALVGPSFGAKASVRPAKSRPAAATRTVVLDVTGLQ